MIYNTLNNNLYCRLIFQFNQKYNKTNFLHNNKYTQNETIHLQSRSRKHGRRCPAQPESSRELRLQYGCAQNPSAQSRSLPVAAHLTHLAEKMQQRSIGHSETRLHTCGLRRGRPMPRRRHREDMLSRRCGEDPTAGLCCRWLRGSGTRSGLLQSCLSLL